MSQIPPIVVHEACLCWQRDEEPLRQAFREFVLSVRYGHHCGVVCPHVMRIDRPLGRFQNKFNVIRALARQTRSTAIRLIIDRFLPQLESIPPLAELPNVAGPALAMIRDQPDFAAQSVLIETLNACLRDHGYTPRKSRQTVFVAKIAMIHRPDLFMPIDRLTRQAVGLDDVNQYQQYRSRFLDIAIVRQGAADWDLAGALAHERSKDWIQRYGPIPWPALMLRVIDKQLMYEAKKGNVCGLFTEISEPSNRLLKKSATRSF